MDDFKSKPESFWREKLDDLTFKVTRKKGTEKPFSGQYHDAKSTGTYHCICCDQQLFSSETKFDSGTGWPSFYDIVSSNHVELRDDNSLFRKRIEVLCSQCGAHLGHVFNDGPEPTGKRYCINSVALKMNESK